MAGYFQELMGMTDDQASKSQILLAERSLKRQLASAYDDAAKQKLDAEGTIEAMYQLLRRTKDSKSFDINKVVEERKRVRNLEWAMETVGGEYTRLFGEEIPKIG